MPANRLEVDFGVWGTLRKIAITLVVGAILGGLGIWYISILKQTTRLQREIEAKQEIRKKQLEICQKYEEEIIALRTDPDTVERMVREKLGYVKPNETIYIFEPPREPSRSK